MAGRLWDWRRFGRLLRLVTALTVAALAVILSPPWIRVLLTSARIRRVAISLLIGLKITYGVVLVGALIGTIVLGAIFYRARRMALRRPIVARGLLLCCACMIGLPFAEAIAARWRAPVRYVPSPPSSDPELTTRFAEPHGDSEVNLVVLGESSAAGVPYESWLSVGEIVAWKLGEVIPERRFRALVLAKPSDTLEIQHRKLATLRHRPDAVIVYCGHNEFSSRIPWSRRVHHYRDERPSFLERFDELAGRASPVCGLIQRAADKYRIEIVPSSSAKPPLVDAPAFTRAEFAASLTDFRRRLEAIADYCQRIGALVILVVPPSNDADFEPLRSILPPETPRADREAFARDFRAVRQREAADPVRGIEQYRALLARQPGFAESHYRLARLLENTGAWELAYQHFIAARDLDGMPMRCVTAFQQIYRDVATSHDCALVDGQALFHAIGPHGLLDDSLFNDIMHPSIRGHIALARGIMEAVCARRSLGWHEGVQTPAIDPAQCVAHFGLRPSDWKSVCEWGEMFYSAAARLRYDPSQCRAKQWAYKEALRRIAAGEPAETVGLPNVGIPPALKVPSTARAAPLTSTVGG
jgi:lysophospholipase L1-like esterase